MVSALLSIGARLEAEATVNSIVAPVTSSSPDWISHGTTGIACVMSCAMVIAPGPMVIAPGPIPPAPIPMPPCIIIPCPMPCIPGPTHAGPLPAMLN